MATAYMSHSGHNAPYSWYARLARTAVTQWVFSPEGSFRPNHRVKGIAPDGKGTLPGVPPDSGPWAFKPGSRPLSTGLMVECLATKAGAPCRTQVALLEDNLRLAANRGRSFGMLSSEVPLGREESRWVRVFRVPGRRGGHPLGSWRWGQALVICYPAQEQLIEARPVGERPPGRGIARVSDSTSRSPATRSASPPGSPRSISSPGT